MVSNEKQILRVKSKAVLASLEDRVGISRALRDRLHASVIWQQAGTVYGYAPLASEPDWLGEAPPDGKVVAFPRLDGPALHFFLTEKFQPGSLGVREPVGNLIAPPPDLVLVPGLAFDRSGHRLGRGKGYYDRWLEAHPGVKTLGICFACQIVEAVPREPHDVRLDGVLTEDGFLGEATAF